MTLANKTVAPPAINPFAKKRIDTEEIKPYVAPVIDTADKVVEEVPIEVLAEELIKESEHEDMIESISDEELNNVLPAIQVVDDQGNPISTVDDYVRLYKADKYAPYQIVTDDEAIAIMRKNIGHKVRDFSRESSPGAKDQENMANTFMDEQSKRGVYNLNYFSEDHSVRSCATGFLSMGKYHRAELEAWTEKTKGKMEGFRGRSLPMTGYSIKQDYYIFDFDDKGGMMETLNKITLLLDDLIEKDIKFRLFSSGSKGWHLYIHKSYIAVPDSKKDEPDFFINKYIARHIMEKFNLYTVNTKKIEALSDDSNQPASLAGKTITTKHSYVDITIYNPVNAFRMPFSRNEKTDFVKREFAYRTKQQVVDASMSTPTPITIDQVQSKDQLIYIHNNSMVMEQLFVTLLKPSQTLIDNTTIWLTLTEDMFTFNLVDNTSINDINVTDTIKREFLHPMYGKACMYNMIEDRSPSERRNTGLRLMSWLKNDLRFKPRATHAWLQAWNGELAQPLKKSEISSMMNAYDKTNTALCKDHIALSYCPMNNSCVFNKVRTLADNAYVTSTDAYQIYQDFESMDKSAVIHLNDYYEGNTIIMYPKEITCCVAGSGVGKSVIVNDICLRSSMPIVSGGKIINDEYINVLLSNEMNVRQVVRRDSLYLGLDLTDPKDVEFYKFITRNRIILQENLPLQKLRDRLLAMQDKLKKKIKLIGLDYFGIQRCYYPGTTKLITEGVSKADVMSDLLPEFVRDLDAHLLFASQPTKAVQGGGMVPLTEESCKFGQAVQALAGQILAAWRPFKGIQATDNVMTMQVVKNRDGEQTSYLDYYFKGSTYTIGDLIKSPTFKHKDPITLKGD